LRIATRPQSFQYRTIAKITAFVAFLVLSGSMLSAAARAQSPSPAAINTPPSESRPPCSDGKAYCLPPEKLPKAQALGHIRTGIEFGSQLWSIAVLLLLLTSGAARRVAVFVERKTARRPLQALLFSASIAAILFLIAQLPVAAIAHAASLRYGISVQAWPSWLLDECKGLILTILLEAPLLTLLYALMRWPWSRRLYWFWAAVFTIPLIILGVFLLPALIEPLFDKFEPLTQSHPALVAQLQRVVARTGTQIPPSRMFLMKASEKSNGLNAYVTGIGASKRIVVWDTTADRMPQDEILFTFAHESGHYVLNHIPKGLALGSILLFPFFFLVSWLSNHLNLRWGSAWNTADIANPPAAANLTGLAVFLLAFTILQFVTEPIPNTISRHFEHEADVYGQEAIHGIVPNPQQTAVAAFSDLGEAYLDDPDPSPIFEFWTYDHPSIQTRATFAARYNPWTSRGQPKFFPR
jgi:Zn-dependent protease with chaperone function